MKRYSCHLIVLCLLWLIFSGSWVLADESTRYSPIQIGGSVESIHDASVADAEIAFRLIFNQLLEEINESFTVKVFDDNEALIGQFREGKVQGIFIGSLRFLELDDLVHPTGRFVVQYGPTLKQRYLVLVRNGDKEQGLSDLRGRKLGVCVGHNVGKRFLDVMLMQRGLPVSDSFFGEINELKAGNTVIVDLYFGGVDVAVVPEYGYQLALELNPQIGEALSVIMESDPMVYQVVGMRYDFPRERMQRIEPHILKKAASRRSARLLQTFHISSFHRATEDVLKEVRELDARYKSLIKRAQ